MPSVFEQAFAENLPALYGAMGMDASYTDKAGVMIDGLSVRVHRHPFRQVEGKGGTGEVQTADLFIQDSGDQGIAKVVAGGRFTIEPTGTAMGLEVWTIETTPVHKNGEFVCSCSRSGKEREMGRRGSSNA